MPPFIIFSDSSLQEMAYYFPIDKESFSQIMGVGQKKLESFGDDFLEIINIYIKENNLTAREFKNVQRQKISRPSIGQTYFLTLNFLEQGLSLNEVAQARGLVVSTIISHLEKAIENGSRPNIQHLRPESEVFDPISEAFKKCGMEALSPAFVFLGGKYDYETLKIVRIFLKMN